MPFNCADRRRGNKSIAMKALMFLLTADTLLSAGWEAVQKISANTKILVVAGAPREVRGILVSADETTLVVRSTSGEQSIARGDIQRVRVADPSGRVKKGVLATAIGAGAGFAIGFAICPHCANEGAAGKFTAPLTAAGAGVGSLGFLPLPYRTIYSLK
jgi:hypothetical protein